MLSAPEILPLITATASAFNAAMASGIAKTPLPPKMQQLLRQNIFIFSGFKTHAQLSAASALLMDGDKLKPFDRFAGDVRQINKEYNLHYLRAEYNFAVHSARAAAQWSRFAESADRYYLQYRTAKDERVRASHQALDEITLPLSDPFWSDYFPPNGWNCRCTVLQVLKSKYAPSDPQAAMAAGIKATTILNKRDQNKAAIFRFNPGIEHKIFPPRHPYLPKGCSSCEFKLDYKPGSPQCQACNIINQCWNDKKKSDTAKLRKHYMQEMERLLSVSVSKKINSNEINIIFDRHSNAHLYSDTFNRSRILQKDDLKNLDETLKNASFVGDAKISKKRKDSFTHFYYFKAVLHGKTIFLNVAQWTRDLKDGKTIRKYYLYSITDKIR